MSDHLKSVRELLTQARTHQILHRTEQTLVGAIEGLLEWAELQAGNLPKLSDGSFGRHDPDCWNCSGTGKRKPRLADDLVVDCDCVREPTPQDNPGDRTEWQAETAADVRYCELRPSEMRQRLFEQDARISELEAQLAERTKNRDDWADMYAESVRVRDYLKEQLSLARNERDELGKRLVDEALASLPPPVAPEPAEPRDERYHPVLRFARAILHGDDKHQGWLLGAAQAFIDGQPVPAPAQAQVEPERRGRCRDCGATSDDRGCIQHHVTCGHPLVRAPAPAPDVERLRRLEEWLEREAQSRDSDHPDRAIAYALVLAMLKEALGGKPAAPSQKEGR